MDDSYQICWTLESWQRVLRAWEDSPRSGIDFETCPDLRNEKKYTSSLRAEFGGKVAGVAIAWLEGDDIHSAYCPTRHYRHTAGGEQLRPWQVMGPLGDAIRRKPAEKLIVVANLSMELSFMMAEGLPWPKHGQLHDLLIATRVLNKGIGYAELIGLKPLQKEYLKKDMSSKNEMDTWLREHKMKPGRDIWKAPVALAGYYAQDDARDTLHIWSKWEHLVYQKPTQWWWERPPDKSHRFDLYEMEVEAGRHSILNCMRGIRVDVPFTRRQSKAANMLQDFCREWIRAYFQMPTINPGSATQMRGILFGDAIGVQISLGHLTDSFKKLPEREQVRVLEGTVMELSKYASLDIEALRHYGIQHPEHSDLTFMLAVYRKCTTAINWFEDRVEDYSIKNCADPWWVDHPDGWVHAIFHRLRTVGTISGRMSSSDYNAQQVPKRTKMILDADRLFNILTGFLEDEELTALRDAVTVVPVKEGDEAKTVGLEAGQPVADFSVRKMFIARLEHTMRLWDLSQVEMRGFAHFSGNTLLCGGYGQPMPDEDVTRELTSILSFCQGGQKTLKGLDVDRHLRMDREDSFDIHSFVAQQLNIGRKPAKGINFGIVYGMGKKKLARSLGWSVAEGKQYLGEYHRNFPEIQLVQGKIKGRLRDRGYIFDPFGRRYYLPMNKSYVGLNRLIQGWAASIFKTGYVRTCEMFTHERMGAGCFDPIIGMRRPLECKVLNVVHDETVAEMLAARDTPELDYMVRTCMTAFHQLKVPLGTSSERSKNSWDEAVEVAA